MLAYSQTILATTNHNSGKGSIRWMAYELLASEEDEVKHTKESDMWAYGMVIYVRQAITSIISL